MSETLSRELPRSLRKNMQVSLVVLDIDHFKHFNDTYGHAAGDYILIRLYEVLKSRVRNEDVICRMGGEEFLILLPDTGLKVALERAEIIRAAVEDQDLFFEEQPLGKLTISLGVATFPQHGTSAAEVLNNADRALYQAKNNGRNRVEVA